MTQVLFTFYLKFQLWNYHKYRLTFSLKPPFSFFLYLWCMLWDQTWDFLLLQNFLGYFFLFLCTEYLFTFKISKHDTVPTITLIADLQVMVSDSLVCSCDDLNRKTMICYWNGYYWLRRVALLRKGDLETKTSLSLTSGHWTMICLEIKISPL